MNRTAEIAAGLASIALLLGACGGSEPTSQAEKDRQIAEARDELEASDAAEAYTPTPADFAIEVRVKEEECFGSAGCNVTIGITPSYSGDLNYGNDPWDVTYEIVGADDGATTNTMTLEGENISFDDEALLQTQQKGTKITAKVTRVDPGY